MVFRMRTARMVDSINSNDEYPPGLQIELMDGSEVVGGYFIPHSLDNQFDGIQPFLDEAIEEWKNNGQMVSPMGLLTIGAVKAAAKKATEIFMKPRFGNSGIYVRVPREEAEIFLMNFPDDLSCRELKIAPVLAYWMNDENDLYIG